MSDALRSIISSLSWSQVWERSEYGSQASWLQALSSHALNLVNSLIYTFTGASYIQLLCSDYYKLPPVLTNEELLCQLDLTIEKSKQLLLGIDLDDIEAVANKVQKSLFNVDLNTAAKDSEASKLAKAKLRSMVSIRQAIELELMDMLTESAAATSWDSNLDTQRKCVELHTCIYQESYSRSVEMPPRSDEKAKHGLNWRALGFQGLDPTTDFRGMGNLGLRHFHYLCTNTPTDVIEMIVESGSWVPDPTQPWYSFALVSIHMSRFVLELLQNRLVLRQIAEFMQSKTGGSSTVGLEVDPDQDLYQDLELQKSRSMVRSFTDELHSRLTKQFHAFWKQQIAAQKVKSVMDTEATLDEFQRIESWNIFSGTNKSPCSTGKICGYQRKTFFVLFCVFLGIPVLGFLTPMTGK